MIKKLDGQFVVPGVKLGVVEEFMPGRGTVEVEGTVYSMLHISNSSPRFERSMGDVCKPNDIIRGKVIDVSQRIPKLTTVGRDMGVTKAYCSRCGGELVLSGRILRCTLCLNVERRRLAEDFGPGGDVPS